MPEMPRAGERRDQLIGEEGSTRLPEVVAAGYSPAEIRMMVQELLALREEVTRLRRELADTRAVALADEAANLGRTLLSYVLDVLCALLLPERGQTIVVGNLKQGQSIDLGDAASMIGPLQAAQERPALDKALQGQAIFMNTRYDAALWLPVMHGASVAVILCLRRAPTNPFTARDKEVGEILGPLVISALQTGHQRFDLNNNQEELRTLSATFSARVRQAGAQLIAMGRDAERLAQRFGMDAEMGAATRLGGILHDIGTVDLADDLLSKEGALNANEVTRMRAHPVFGAEIVRQVPGMEKVIALVLYHHERWDGTGYPSGLAGGEIPLGARIIAVVDAFHAMISHRPHRKPRTVEEALRELQSCSGSQFDWRVVDEFTRLIREG